MRMHLLLVRTYGRMHATMHAYCMWPQSGTAPKIRVHTTVMSTANAAACTIQIKIGHRGYKLICIYLHEKMIGRKAVSDIPIQESGCTIGR